RSWAVAMTAAQNEQSSDCIVIGGGHNGLVCAATLARGGRKVLVLEAAKQLGGAALTREFAPGFRVSAGAHLLHLMPADLLRELDLGAHGLEWAATDMVSTALVEGGSALVLGAHGAGQGLSAADAQAYAAYFASMRRFAAALAPIFSRTAPRLGTDDWTDRLALLRMGGMNVYDLLEENFESAALKGALAFDAVLGANFGPRSPGTVLTLLYRLAAESAAGARAMSQPKGGMGTLCDALGKAAAAAGASIRTDAPVASVLVEDDRASGVVLESGETLRARSVISSADPKTTFLKLLGARHLDTGFVRRVNHIRCRGLAAKLHLALNRAPPFSGVSNSSLRGRLLIAPSLNHLAHAYNHAKYSEYSPARVMEITVPTLTDPTLAPSGRHVLSAVVQYAPYALKEGWAAGRQGFMEAALDSLERLAPGLRGCVVAAELLTPADIEQQFRISGGHWHHGDLAFDQFLMVRPVPGAAQYRTPVDGLYLCGAGCHPGGGVMGVAGRNAAREVLKSGMTSP